MLCLTENGTVYTFGENKLGQLGQGNQTDAVLSPATVRLFLCLIFLMGLYWNMLVVFEMLYKAAAFIYLQIQYNGQPIVKVACGAEFSMIVDCKGNLYSFGCPEYGQLGMQQCSPMMLV